MIRFEQAKEKGKIGEELIKKFFEAKGVIVYRPNTEGAHWIDMLAIKEKKSAIAVDVKSKARMNKFPATGVNQKSFEEYLKFSLKHNMPFWIIFIDELMHEVYGNTIENLEKPRKLEGKNYPLEMKTKNGDHIHLWPLTAMIKIGDLDENIIQQLTSLNQRGYNYSPCAFQLDLFSSRKKGK